MRREGRTDHKCQPAAVSGLWPWTSHGTFLSLTFLLCEMRKRWLCCLTKCCLDKMSQVIGKHFVSRSRVLAGKQTQSTGLLKSYDPLLTVYKGKPERPTLKYQISH